MSYIITAKISRVSNGFIVTTYERGDQNSINQSEETSVHTSMSSTLMNIVGDNLEGMSSGESQIIKITVKGDRSNEPQ